MSNPEQTSNCANEIVIPFSSLPEYDQALIKQNAEKYGRPVPTEVYACENLNTEGLVKVSQPTAIKGLQKNSDERIDALRDLRNQTSPSQNGLVNAEAQGSGNVLDINFALVFVVIWAIVVMIRIWKRKKKFAYLNSIKADSPDSNAGT